MASDERYAQSSIMMRNFFLVGVGCGGEMVSLHLPSHLVEFESFTLSFSSQLLFFALSPTKISVMK